MKMEKLFPRDKTVHSGSGGAPQAEKRFHSSGIRLLRFFLPLLILAAGVGAAAWLLQTGPQAKPRPATPSATLVEVEPVVFSRGKAMVEAMGKIVAANEIELKPRVGGEIIEISSNLVPGGLFRTGQTLLRIDPTDYELVVRQLSGEAAQVEAALRLEQGNQDIARREYEILGEVVSDDDLELVLRQPQLETVSARLETARARLEKARLDLERTVVKAPFNGVVQSRQINIGARVTENTPLATLVGTDRYWIEVVVPVRDLHWLDIPVTGSTQGSLVRVYDQAAWGDGIFREGRVIRLAADLEEHGRLARLFIAVDDPLQLKREPAAQPKLFIGSYVRVEIEGHELDAVVEVNRSALRDGDHVWVMDGNDKLEIRPVEVAFRGRDRVLISNGIRPEERLVISGLAAPVAGILLRTSDREGMAGGTANPAGGNGVGQ
jgi:RND family efflux transporter MFP subunit